MRDFFRDVLSESSSAIFLKRVISKYHYWDEDEELLKKMVEQLKAAVIKDGGWDSFHMECADFDMEFVAVTLGDSSEKLLRDYLEKGELTESLMLQSIGSEILLAAYRRINECIRQKTDKNVERYYFFGSDERYPLEQMPALLKLTDTGIECNRDFCLLPSLSVAFLASLTEENVCCEGICTNCGRDCPNKMTKRAMPYGYSRIFGE